MEFISSKISQGLKSLGSTAIPEFGYWLLVNGQRIIVSVIAAEFAREVCDSIVVIVRVTDGEKTPVWIGEAGPFPGAFMLHDDVAALLGEPDLELHVHARTHGDSARRDIIEAMKASDLAKKTGKIAA